MNIEEARLHVRNGCVAGLVSASLTAIFAIGGFLGYSLWELVDAALILGLTFGIWRFSRTCAVLMILYFVMSRIGLWMENRRPGLLGLGVAILFFYLYAQAVRATFAYHSAKKTVGV